MIDAERETILTLSIMAGLTDGVTNEAEGAQFQRVAERVALPVGQLAAVHHRVLRQHVSVAQAVEPLKSAELRQLAYEMAICVCNADEVQADAERLFLFELQTQLHLKPENAAAIQARRSALLIQPWTRGGVNE